MNGLEKIGKRLLKVEEFISEVGKNEKWILPPIEVWEIQKEHFDGLYLQCRERKPPSGIKAFPNIFLKRIFIKEGYTNRTTALHEILHFLQLEENPQIKELREVKEFKEKYKMNNNAFITLTEIQANGFSHKLARKYKKEWEEIVREN